MQQKTSKLDDKVPLTTDESLFEISNIKEDIKIRLEDKVEKLTSEIESLRYTLLNHINFIEDTYTPLKRPIEKMKSFFDRK